MEILIKTTFLIIIFFSVVNFSVNVITFYQKKDNLYRLTAFFWASMILNFLVQAIAQNGDAQIIMGFSFSLLPVNLLCMTLFSIMGRTYDIRKSIFLFFIATGMSYGLILAKAQFWISALPLSAAAGIPLIVTAVNLFLVNRNNNVYRLIGFVLFVFCIHGFNFAFFRNDPENQLWGWLVSYAIYQALATLLPTAVLADFHYRESERMKSVIREKTVSLNEALGFKNFLFKTLAHDISTPLSICKSSLEMIRLTQSHSNIDMKYIARAERSVDSVITMTNDLKLLEKRDMAVSYVNLDNLITESLERLRTLAEAKKLKIVYSSDNLKKIEVSVNASAFVGSVAGNLIRNCIKFSPIGSPVEIRADQVGDYAIIIFSNEGERISDDVLLHIFDFDYDKSKPGTLGEAGTGWGLPICKVLVKSFGGDISISSTDAPNRMPMALIQVEIKLPARRTASSQSAPQSA